MTTVELLRRLLRTARGVAITLAVMVALLAAVATAAQQVAGDFASRQLRHTLDGLSGAQGDVVGSWVTTEPEAAPEDTWSAFAIDAETLRSRQPEPLRTLMGTAQFVSTAAQPVRFTPPISTGYFRVSLHLAVDPALRDHVTLVSGSWPGPPPTVGGDPFDIVVLEETARRMSWSVGTVLPDGFTVAGTYRVHDPSDPRWDYIPGATRRGELSDPNLGLEVTMAVFTSPDASPAVGAVFSLPMRTQLWYRLDPERVGASTVSPGLLNQQLTGLLTRRQPVGSQEVRLASGLGEPLQHVLTEQSRTSSLLAMFTLGALVMGGALIVLASELVLHRHRAARFLLHARGASVRQLRGLLALVGLIVGIPAALLGQVLALWLIPGSAPPRIIWAGAAASGLCVLALATLPTPTGLGRKAATTHGRRSRWLWEAALALVTAVSVWLLLRPVDATDTGGVDVLVALAPTLVIVMGALAVMRLSPVPLGWVARALGRGRGLAGFVGIHRGIRSPSGGLLPAAVLVLGASLAMMSATMQGTLAQGVTDAAWSDNGSAVRLSGQRITDGLAKSLGSIDGVTAVTRLYDQGPTVLRPRGGEPVRVDLWLATRELQGSWAGSPVGRDVPSSLFGADEVPSVVVGGVSPTVEGTVELDGMGPTVVAARWDVLPGFPTGSAWVLGDVADVPADLVVPATIALLGIDDDADPEAVGEAVEALIDAGVVTTVQDRLDTARQSPTVAGLGAVTVSLAALSAVFMVAALVIGQVIGGDERHSTMSRLATMGLSQRQATGIRVGELAPMALVAVAGGTLLGIGAAALVVNAVDLSVFTGGRHAPRLYVDPVLVGGVLAAISATVALTIVVGTHVASRGTTPAPPEGES